jgi:hypothetical protein
MNPRRRSAANLKKIPLQVHQVPRSSKNSKRTPRKMTRFRRKRLARNHQLWAADDVTVEKRIPG